MSFTIGATVIFTGICWTLAYIDIILRGFKDKTYGMPLFALAFNITWEFIFGILVDGEVRSQRIFNVVCFFLDVMIAYTYFKYGRKEFPKTMTKFFIPWSLAAFVTAFIIVYSSAFEFRDFWGARYSAFAINLIISVSFFDMLVRRNNVDGQSMYIAILKWLGTLLPTIILYRETGSQLVLALGIAIFIYDVVYIGMLYQKFVELKLNPFTRKSVSE